MSVIDRTLYCLLLTVGFLDPTPGGVMAAGESYEATNAREVEEEMGIRGVAMEHLFTFFYQDSLARCWGGEW